MATEHIPHSFSHVAICVSDLERSISFYQDAFGFSRGQAFTMGNEIRHLVGVEEDMLLTMQMMHLGQVAVELVYFHRPSVAQGDSVRPINQVGLSHLSLTVDDVDAAAARVERAGGRILRESHCKMNAANADSSVSVFSVDPDGTRIELYRPPDDAGAFARESYIPS